MTTATQENKDLFEDILDTNLDDIDDLPEFLDFCPTGSFTLVIKDAAKDVVDMDGEDGKQIHAPVIRVVYELKNIRELHDETEAGLVKVADTDGMGSCFSESFFLHKDKAKTLAVFKARYKEIIKKFGFTNIDTLIEGMKGLEVTAVVKSTKSKKDADRFFINTKNIQPV